MIGSFALIFKSLPIVPYQAFLKVGVGVILSDIFAAVYRATFGLLSIYMAACVGFFMEKNTGGRASFGYGASLVSVCSFLIAVGFLTDSFDVDSLNASGMFIAILCSTLLSRIYLKLTEKLSSRRILSDGSNPYFSKAVFAIIPILIVIGAFTVLDYLICLIFGADNMWQLMARAFTSLFAYVGEDFWGGLLYVLLSTVMWFFGIHGSDVLESVNTAIFVPAANANVAAAAAGLHATHIYTKTFFDVFVLMGGCGTLLCLLIAILLFSRRRSNRSLAKLAAFPMLFNINEIMVFGLPIIYNPVFLVPFICTPLASYLIASAALSLGLVPLTSAAVEWTTPVLIGGYEATGSVAGLLLQLVILAAGTAIYAPFVRRYDREKAQQAVENLNELVDIYKEHEAMSCDVILTELEGIPGEVAKQLAADLDKAIARNELFFLYQPQYSYSGRLFGAEALLRWKHPQLGLIYPPLVIKLATEAGLLGSLERHIYSRVGSEIENVPGITFSINATAVSLQDDDFVDFLVGSFPGAVSGKAHICVEVTEQESISFNAAMSARLAKLKSNGFRLAIDDFSMGHTSFKYMQEGSFDEVKLDGAITRKVLDDPNVRDIISSIVFLSQEMGITVVAEYIETEEQREALADLGCENYQGYLYSPPVPMAELMQLSAKNAASMETQRSHKKVVPARTMLRPDLVDQVSHEILTQLTSIIGLSDIAQQKYDNRELFGIFEQIKECSRSLILDLRSNPDVQKLMKYNKGEFLGGLLNGDSAAAPSETKTLSGLHALLCEDNDLNAMVVSELLSSKNMTVVWARDGLEGVNAFCKEHFDIVLMDIRMPVMDGYEAAKAIRRSGRPGAVSVPIIAMTADVFTNEDRQEEEAFINGHVPKPVDPSVLFLTIQNTISRENKK